MPHELSRERAQAVLLQSPPAVLSRSESLAQHQGAKDRSLLRVPPSAEAHMGPKIATMDSESFVHVKRNVGVPVAAYKDRVGSEFGVESTRSKVVSHADPFDDSEDDAIVEPKTGNIQRNDGANDNRSRSQVGHLAFESTLPIKHCKQEGSPKSWNFELNPQNASRERVHENKASRECCDVSSLKAESTARQVLQSAPHRASRACHEHCDTATQVEALRFSKNLARNSNSCIPAKVRRTHFQGHPARQKQAGRDQVPLTNVGSKSNVSRYPQRMRDARNSRQKARTQRVRRGNASPRMREGEDLRNLDDMFEKHCRIRLGSFTGDSRLLNEQQSARSVRFGYRRQRDASQFSRADRQCDNEHSSSFGADVATNDRRFSERNSDLDLQKRIQEFLGDGPTTSLESPPQASLRCSNGDKVPTPEANAEHVHSYLRDRQLSAPRLRENAQEAQDSVRSSIA